MCSVSRTACRARFGRDQRAATADLSDQLATLKLALEQSQQAVRTHVSSASKTAAAEAVPHLVF